MQFLYYALFSALIVGVDQFTKYLVVANIPLQGEVPFLPGILQLTYVQNSLLLLSGPAVAVCPDFSGVYLAPDLGVFQKAHGVCAL